MKSVLDQVRVVIYRYHEKGLEVFLIEPELENAPEVWSLPAGTVTANDYQHLKVDLSLENTDGYNTYAIEADWHDIPSIRGIIKSDVKRLKNKIKEVSNKGTFVSVKDALKRVMPDEYAALKELKDVLKERNLLTNL